jgi:MOSC domain-containing protein YiiM
MGYVTAVSLSKEHRFSKPTAASIRLLAGLGIAGDTHMGETVKHRHMVAKDPTLPNLCQVHLLHEELFDELRDKGFVIRPGDIGENVTTRDIDLLSLPTDTRLYLGASAIVRVTGLRSPCIQMDRFQKGLMAATLDKDADGNLIRKAGIMSVVLADGDVQAGDRIEIEFPAGPHRALQPV